MPYIVGERIEFTVQFANSVGAAADPQTVTFSYQESIDDAVILVYGVDAEVVKVSTGLYRVAITLTTHGTFKWKWEGISTDASGLPHDVDQGSFAVEKEIVA